MKVINGGRATSLRPTRNREDVRDSIGDQSTVLCWRLPADQYTHLQYPGDVHKGGNVRQRPEQDQRGQSVSQLFVTSVLIK